MNHTLDQFSDNPIIDTLVSWPPRSQAVTTIRASAPFFRDPFIEVTLDDGEVITRSFGKGGFGEYWAEAIIILEAITPIRLISDLRSVPALGDPEGFVKEILSEREESIQEASYMFESGMYKQYLWQFGEDYKDLPEQVMQNIATARARSQGDNTI